MRRNAIVTVAVVIAVLALVSQLAIPAYVSSQVEDRLTENGGTAKAEVHAFPALGLIGGNGDRIKVRGKDLRLDLPEKDADVFDRLDGFDEVDTELTNVRTGPFAVERFELKRTAEDGNYRMTMQASSTPRELSQYAAAQLGGPLGGLMGRFADSLLPEGSAPIPVTLDAVIRSEDGRAQVVTADGDIAGLPARPIAGVIARAVAGRL